MSDERRRILRMLAEGTISVDECEELLHALSDRRVEKVQRDVAAAKGKRPVWPYVLLVILAIVALPTWRVGMEIMRNMIPVVAGPVGILLTVFWIVMIVDCIRRRQDDFRLLFTQKHEHEKWIWCGVVLLGSWLGALAYFIVIRQSARTIAPPMARKVHEPEPGGDAEAEASQALPPAKTKPEEPFTPWPRARSLWRFVVYGILLVIVLAALAVFIPDRSPNIARTFVLPHRVLYSPRGVFMLSIPLTIILLTLWTFIFWIWMLIDCLARDYREFGTLITGDKSLDKVVWLLLILFTFVIGGLAYHISIRRRPRPAPGNGMKVQASGAG